MSIVHQALHTLRWRLIPVRYAGKVGRSLARRQADGPRSRAALAIVTDGHAPGPRLADADVAAIRERYAERIARVVAVPGSDHPFVNLVEATDLVADDPVFRFAMSPGVLDVADDYFGGRFTVDSIQLLYSWPTEGQLRASQQWHKDYGDSRSFHCVAYVNDVLTPEDGPFVYVDRADTRRIGASPLIRRIGDAQFASELDSGVERAFYGRAGESVLIDPAACYHYGSRCRRPRLAIFATFNTDRPFVSATPAIRAGAAQAAAEAAKVRPDLDEGYLRRVFGAAG